MKDPIIEDIEPENKHLFHPSKIAKVAQPHEIEGIFPDLGPNSQKYLELITSESYKECLRKLEHYTGKEMKSVTMPAMVEMIIRALTTVVQLQQGHEKELSDLAVRAVLDLPEFVMFKDLVANGQIKIDARIDEADLTNAITEAELQEKEAEEQANQATPEEKEEKAANDQLTPAEQENQHLARAFNGITDEQLKRQFANMVMQGNAVNKFYLYNIVNEELTRINPRLPNLYGICGVGVHSLYYSMPEAPISRAILSQGALGSAEITPGIQNDEGDGGNGGGHNEPQEQEQAPVDNTYTIRCRSPFFPYLIHEIVKSLWNYLSMDIVDQKDLDRETVDSETLELMAGPDLYKKVVQYVPQNKINLLPLVYRLLLQQPVPNIKKFLGGGGYAQSFIGSLVKQAEEQMGAYNNQGEEQFKDQEPTAPELPPGEDLAPGEEEDDLPDFLK